MFATTAFAQDFVVTLGCNRGSFPPGGPNPTQSFIVTPYPALPTTAVELPTAVVILLAGGDGNIHLTPSPTSADGTLDINSNNFLVRSRWLFAGNGYYTITLDAASDFLLLLDGLKGEQGSAPHITDVMQVIAWARMTVPGVPVWVVGTSRGTAGAFVAADFTPALLGPDGLVFASPINASTDPDSLLSANLAAITVPVLLFGDVGNTCPNTLASGDPAIKKMLTSSAMASTETVASGKLYALTDSCDPLSDHGFFGIENNAVHKIAVWIASAPFI
jgi:hypothetical protein